ncbi:membrane protein [Salisaeta longa]|uniref:membrane protein n=1 Tax=Salisaeta longa TaxID=503170 RepID=UPI0003B46DDD|nr:membrane protein [Salisaeta longa]
MAYLAAAIFCSIAIGVVFKHTGGRVDRVALVAINYGAAVGVALVLLSGGGASAGALTWSPALVAMSLATGALLIGGFFMLSWATDVAGLSLAVGVMRVSVVLPFVASWLVWHEPPSPAQLVGMVIASGAFFLLSHRPQDEGPDASAARVSLVLLFTFLLGGAVDISMKAFEEWFGAHNSRTLFLLLSFGVAFLVGLAIVAWRGWRHGRWPTRRALGWGVLLGIINYGSLEFLLAALNRLPGTLVFPVNNIAIVLGATLLGVWTWGERLTRFNRWGLAAAVGALALLGW